MNDRSHIIIDKYDNICTLCKYLPRYFPIDNSKSNPKYRNILRNYIEIKQIWPPIKSVLMVFNRMNSK